MRILSAAVLFSLVVLIAGCGAAQKTSATYLTPDEFEFGDVEPPAAGTDVSPALPLLGIEAVAPARSYDLDRSPKRPPRVAGNLDVPLGRRWKYIVIHHSATDVGSEASFDRYHREHNGWLGVGYDFVIGNGRGSADGLVEVTFRWEKQMQGAHADHPEYNNYGVGICLVGDFDRDYPTTGQMEALVGLVNHLQARCRIPTDRILGHRHIRPGGTRCPGGNFPWYELLSRLDH